MIALSNAQLSIIWHWFALAPKGHINSAQGNALGRRADHPEDLKGRFSSLQPRYTVLLAEYQMHI
jgi:hypothetical protein